MSIEVIKLDGESTVKLVMPERFDFNLHREFREACEENPKSSCYIIDFDRTQYLDSSALGMLLQLWELAGGKESGVNIVNARENVVEVLNIANFGKLMQIS